MKGGHCSALNHFYKSSISDKVFYITSHELVVNGKTCEILDKCFEYTNKHRCIFV